MIPEGARCNQELENTQHIQTRRETKGNILIWIGSSLLVNPKARLQSLLYKAQKYPKSDTEQHKPSKCRPHGIRHTHTATQNLLCFPSVQVTSLIQISPLKCNLKSEKEFVKMCSPGQGKKSLAKIFQMLNLAGSLWHKTDRTAGPIIQL